MMQQKTPSERIAKRMARAGVCSRREAERMILNGQVKVDGKVIESPALNVSADHKIQVNGKPLPDIQETRLWMYHKPVGLVTSHKDEKGRKTVFDALPKHLPRVISVGRLDMNSEGLLLVTNNGELARALELPSNKLVRTYRARVFGSFDEKKLASLKKGCTIDGIQYGSITVTVESSSKSNHWLTISLQEGKNREVRKVLDSIGLTVNRLIRTQYGKFFLGNLEKSVLKEVNNRSLREKLRDVKNLKL